MCTTPEDGRACGHAGAVVAYRSGRLYCICTKPWDGRACGHPWAVVAGRLYCIRTEPQREGDGGGGEAEEEGRKEEEWEWGREESYNHHTDSGE